MTSAEEVFVKVANAWHNGRAGRAGQLVNAIGTIKWQCQHGHREADVALRCAEQQRAAWIRSGQASGFNAATTAILDRIEASLAALQKKVDDLVAVRRLLNYPAYQKESRA